MGLQFWIIFGLWMAIFLMLAIENLDGIQGLTPNNLFYALCIFLVGAPFFLVANVLEYLLDGVMPEGWDNDDFFKGH